MHHTINVLLVSRMILDFASNVKKLYLSNSPAQEDGLCNAEFSAHFYGHHVCSRVSVSTQAKWCDMEGDHEKR